MMHPSFWLGIVRKKVRCQLAVIEEELHMRFCPQMFLVQGEST